MEKLLTISVAAYNVEACIRQCLDSLVIPEIMDALEVFVVDDGGKDGTLAIAREYEEKYPETFHAVHKENGDYGSTVNYSLAHATGKYFKLLDGDDWLDKEGLSRIIREIKAADNPDIILTRYYTSVPGCELKLQNLQEWWKHCGLVEMKDISFNFICSMWGTTVRTELIQGKTAKLPEHMLYTDQLFIIYSLSRARKMLLLDFPVYCYRVGREGQSTSNLNRARHYKEAIFVVKTMVDYFCSLDKAVKRFITPRVALYHYFTFRSILLVPAGSAIYAELRDFENCIRSKDPRLYRDICLRSKRTMAIRVLRKAGYYLQTNRGGYSADRRQLRATAFSRRYYAALSLGGAA